MRRRLWVTPKFLQELLLDRFALSEHLPMSLGDDLPRSVLDHLFEGFQVIGPDWTYLYVNPAAAKQGRQTPQTLHGRKMPEVYPGIDQTELFTLLRQVMEDRTPRSMENHFSYPDGSSRWFELRIQPVPQGICIHSIDIDERKRGEALLRELNQELERRVAERTRELQIANRDLESFSYSVSHDLRAPLRGIHGFTTLLEESHAPVLSQEGKGYLARIRAASVRMGQLIDALLALARIGHASMSRADVDVSALTQSLARELSQQDPARRVEWVIAPNLRCWCDPNLAAVVFQNLLGNAWKFTAKTEQARIQVRLGSAPGVIEVADNGAGFDMAYAEKLFRPFQRLHTEREFSGTGIGLSTVKRIIDKHDGRIFATGAAGKGATFTVDFGQGPSIY